jgi:hypothetical protein
MVDQHLARLLRRTFGRRGRRDVAVVSAEAYLTALRQEFQERFGLDLLAADAAGTLDALVPEAERAFWHHGADDARAAAPSARRGRGRS